MILQEKIVCMKTKGKFFLVGCGKMGLPILESILKIYSEEQIAVGLSTDLRQLKNLGIRPFYVGLSTALAVGIVSLIGVYILILLGTAIT